MQVHVIADATDREGGYVTERLVRLGARIVTLDRDDLPPFDAEDRPDLLLLLGSHKSAHDPQHVQVVMTESRHVREAMASGVPVMAICYGAQLLARALGGTSYRMPEPELGHRRIDTVDGVLCPRGPWPTLHQDVFVPPRTARVLGSTWFGPQCFIDDAHGARVIAWQFHPEATPETFARWVDQLEAVVRASGGDPELLKRQSRELAPEVRKAAHALVDAALAHLGVDAPTESRTA